LTAVLFALVVLGACSTQNELGSAARSANEPVALAIDTFTTTDTVKSIDYATREITLKGPKGEIATYRAGPDIKNFDRIRVGDQVRATLTQALAVNVRKAGTSPSEGEKVAVSLAPKGAKPSMLVEKTAEAGSKIRGVDRAKRTITLNEPAGGTRTIKLAPDVDVSELKKGDDVVVRYTDALALYVEKPEVPSPGR
jgi:hypothetical protein